MKFTIRSTPIPGCLELGYPVFDDTRGRFVKSFHRDAFLAAGMTADFAETFYSSSRQGVLRGLHFQIPPKDHDKLVYAISGSILDVVLDLRVGSPTFGQHHMLTLSAKSANALFIPKGLAHGFYVPDGDAVVVYMISSIYDADHDQGIRWDSAGIPWPERLPILSKRDKSFPALADFSSPFRYGE